MEWPYSGPHLCLLRGFKSECAGSTPLRRAELCLRGGTDDDLVHIDIGRLLDGERNRAGDRIWRHGEPVSGVGEPSSQLRVCYGFDEFRPDEAWRDDRHAQLVAGFLT